MHITKRSDRIPVSRQDLLHRFLLALFIVLFVSRPTDAASEHLAIESIQVGFNDKFKVGHWTPVRISFSEIPDALQGTLTITVPDGEGKPVAYQFDDIQVSPDSPIAHCYVKLGRVNSSIRVEFRCSHGEQSLHADVHAGLPTAIPTKQRFIVTLGNSVGVDEALIMRARRTNESIEHTVVDSIDALPDLWLGYAGVDVLVLPTRHKMWHEAIDGPKIEAIRKWVRLGGTVLFSCAQHAESFLGDAGHLRELLPGTFAGVGAERETRAIEEYVGGDARLNISESDGRSLAYANIIEPSGRVLFTEGSGAGRHPAVIVGLQGLGRVVFVAFDLDSTSLAAWTGRTELMRQLLDNALGPTEGDEATPVGMTQYGYDDIIGQLRMSLNRFAGVSVMPFSIVALLVAAYILFIGPTDYFLHKRFSKRFELTWLTFPLLVAAFCAVAYFLAAGKGRASMQLNRITVVDVDAKTHEAFGSDWWYVYSPDNRQLNLSVAPDSASLTRLDDRLMLWDGLAGTGFGGMNGGITSQQSVSTYAIKTVQSDDGLTCDLEGIPIDVRSSRSLFSQWTGKFDAEPIESALRIGIENQLDGEVVNTLPFTLDRCWLVYDRWVYKIGSLRPGQRKSMLGLTSRDLRSLLTKQEFVNSRYKTTPWDRDSTDTDSIVRMMMFFSAVRGESYTGLRHRYQSHIDCGQKLQFNRAILVGESETVPTNLVNSGQELPATRSETYFRLSIPVETKR